MKTYRFAWLVIASALQLTPLRIFGAPTDEIQVYDASIVEVGMVNLTWHNNFTPSGGRASDFPGGIAAEHSFNGVTEWAYGVTRWFEAGLYFPIYTVQSSGSVSYDGFKLRTLFVVPDAGLRHFFYGVNFEFSDNTHHWDSRPFTAEMRPIIGWREGPCELIVNPILDYDSSGVRGLNFAPATRFAAHVPRGWTFALEEYDDFGALRRLLPHSQQSHQLFAVVDRSVKSTEVEFGVGRGLTQSSDKLVLKLILSRDFK